MGFDLDCWFLCLFVALCFVGGCFASCFDLVGCFFDFGGLILILWFVDFIFLVYYGCHLWFLLGELWFGFVCYF